MTRYERHKMDVEPSEIRVAMLRAGITQAEIARRCKVSRAMVNRVVDGYTVSDRIRREIASAINKDVRVLWPSTYVLKAEFQKSDRKE